VRGARDPGLDAVRVLQRPQGRRRVAPPIYTAPDQDGALTALATFTDSTLGKKYPAATAPWENAWDQFTPFLAFGPALRKIVYTTNAIESLNVQLRN